MISISVLLANQGARRAGAPRSADQTRLATAVSELARNAIQYAGGGWLLVADRSSPQLLILSAQVSDRGPGIGDVEQALRDGYTSGLGLGVGLPGCQRLMDVFDILTTGTTGTTIVMELHAQRGFGRGAVLAGAP